MRVIGTQAFGIRLPIISKGDDLASIIADSLCSAVNSSKLTLSKNDIVGVTEAILAKSQGNFASIDDIAYDVKSKFTDGVVGVVFPIYSRNRFLNVLKGIAKGAKKIYLLLQYPSDEVGNPIVSPDYLDLLNDSGKNLFSAKEFKNMVKTYKHPFTGIDYIDLYQDVSDNIEIYLSNDPRGILQFTKNILVAEIHNRNTTSQRLIKAGASNVFTLADILSKPVNNSGYNSEYGVLGSNLSTGEILKLFPRDCDEFIYKVQDEIFKRTQIKPEVLIYGDGAFKDPVLGIWELADPVVSPAFTDGLKGQPNEIKIKYVADNILKDMDPSKKQEAIASLIKQNKDNSEKLYSEGTTPRRYADLIGSLCDLMSGSGDKGTPVILVQGYFDDFSSE